MNKHVLIINGMATSGKDTFAECLNNVVPTKHISIVDNVKAVAKLFGWNGAKSEKDRKFLSDLKVLIDDYSNKNYEYVKKEVEEFKSDKNIKYKLLCINMREKEQIERAVKDFDAIAILVYRKGTKEITSNMADAQVYKADYDYIIDNSSDIESLQQKAKNLVELLELKDKKKDKEIKKQKETKDDTTDLCKEDFEDADLYDYARKFIEEFAKAIKESKEEVSEDGKTHTREFNFSFPSNGKDNLKGNIKSKATWYYDPLEHTLDWRDLFDDIDDTFFFF